MAEIKNELFDNIYKETFDDVSKYVVCNCSSLSDVSDILQNIYMEVVKIIDKDNYELLTKPYIYGIARHKIKDYYRKNYKEKDISYTIDPIETINIESIKDESIDIEYNFLLQYNTSKVWKYLKKKSIIISKIFYLHYTLDLTISEIAEELNISESNVKNYLYRTLKELRKYLLEDE